MNVNDKYEHLKVFISYSSKDRERFVDNFAEKLIGEDIDVWYDKWELNYGDSLAKIFDDMLKCDYCISIISKNSIDSNWVKEECDSAFVAKINGKLKFIPLIIMEDNITIPERFDYIRQCQITDITDYDDEFNALVSELLGISKKPEHGTLPNYVNFNRISGFNVFDSLVIKTLGDIMIEQGVSIFFEDLLENIGDNSISKEDIDESVQILKDDGIITFHNYLGNYYPEDIKLTPYGMMVYAENYYENFSEVLNKISSILLNKQFQINQNDFNVLNTPQVLINNVLSYFSNLGYLELHNFCDGRFLVNRLTAKGKREFKNMIN